MLLVLVVISLAVVGCRTLNYTQEDLERERSLLAENMAKVQQGGWGCGGGVGIRPDLSKINLGNIGCPNLGPGVCPGK